MRISDWSSDVCSSGLAGPGQIGRQPVPLHARSRRRRADLVGIEPPFDLHEGGIEFLGLVLVARSKRRPRGLDRRVTKNRPIPKNNADFRIALGQRGQTGMHLPAKGALIVRENDDGHVVTRWFYPSRERSEEHTSELQSLMRISYAVFCLKKKNNNNIKN